MSKPAKVIVGFLVFIVLVIAGVYLFLLSQKPQYSGTLQLKGLQKEVDIFFDEFGVPHICGQNEEDVFFALGYVHAEERLFQMEMMRRVSAGRLSEIFGSSMIPVDKFFRMLGIHEHAERSAKEFLSDEKEPCRKAALAYLDGINAYIEKGKTPLEFRMIGIPKEKFIATDMFLVADYMSFVFQMAFKTDPLMSRIEKKYGGKYLADLTPDYVSRTDIEKHVYDSAALNRVLSFSFQDIQEKLPVSLWLGSNSWAVAPHKSKSAKVLFENDTHIGYSQPATWYEAHLEYPGFSFYGNFLAGFPFAPIGHTRELAWGLTISENDDLDFFHEKTDSLHSGKVWFVDHWETLEATTEVIRVKDSSDVKLVVRSSHHGPVCTDVINDFKEVTDDPVTASWTFLKFPNNLLHVIYGLDHAQKMDDVRDAASQIAAPGLNFIYGDATGNIASWLAAKLVKRPAHVNSCVMLDGSSGKDEWIGWYDFKENPHSENPSEGFVCSANNHPDSIEGILYPGYYTPADRFVRIGKALSRNEKFDMKEMQALQLDAVSEAEAAGAKAIMKVIGEEKKNKTDNHRQASQILSSWNGDHNLEDVAPVIYYKLLYNIMFSAMEDELGEKGFNQFLLTHVEKNLIATLFINDSSSWWDNITTKNTIETRKEIFENSFDKTVSELESQLGKNPAGWKWRRVHTLELIHPVGKKKPFDKFFNVGPFPVGGGNETINQQGFEPNREGIYKTRYGPAMRRVIDFSDPENGESISPSGQSGNVMSKHYADQSKLFLKGQTRKEMMNRKEIEEKCKDKLTLQPQRN